MTKQSEAGRRKAVSNRQRAIGDRRKIQTCFLPAAYCILLSAFCFLTSCSPDKDAPIKADAKSGYCPVCHMRVQADDEWATEIHYSDGTKLMFESPGDMLAFYTAPDKYKVTGVQKDRANITKILLKDYQTRDLIDGQEAKLVYKSKVEGPMGPDFLAFNKRNDAEAFVAANGGKIIALNDVTSEMVQDIRKR